MAWRSRVLSGPFRASCHASSSWQRQHPAQWIPGSLNTGTKQLAPQIDESQEAKLAGLMAVLFLAKEPLPSRKLSQYSNLADGTEARTLVTRLNSQLDSQGRTFRVESVAGGYQMVTRPKFAK